MPMLPVVRGERRTAASIVRYTLLMIGITLLPFLTGDLGWIYLAAAAAARRRLPRARGPPLPRNDADAGAQRSSATRSLYLALLFVAMAVDPVVLA